MSNPDTAMTLRQAVAEVLGLLTGLDLEYDPNQDRFRAIARQINRAMRSMALEKEWSYYSDTVDIGTAAEYDQELVIPSTLRPRVINDDAVRLVDDNGKIWVWAYFLPRDALHKYLYFKGLWCAVTRNTLVFSRPLNLAESGLHVMVPVMREPEMFVIPTHPIDPNSPLVQIPDSTLDQELDFPYPDVAILRAAFYYAQTDPVMQPRVQTLEAQYKDLFYQISEREDRNTDTPYQNGWDLGIQNGLNSHRVGGIGFPDNGVRP